MAKRINQVNVKSGEGTLYNSPIKIIPSDSGVEIGKY